MRKARHKLRIQAHYSKQILNTLFLFLALSHAVHFERLADNLADIHARVERSKRILENDLHLAAHQAQLLALQLHQISSVEHDFARGRPIELENGLAGGRFAAAAFAHQPQGLAALDGEANVVDSLHMPHHALEDAAPNREILFQVAHHHQIIGGWYGLCLKRRTHFILRHG